MILEQGRNGFENLTSCKCFEHCIVANDRMTRQGRHIVFEKHHRRHRLLIRQPDPAKDFGFLVAPDEWIETRLAAITALHHRLPKTDTHLSMRPTDYQRRKLDLLLRILDYTQQASYPAISIRDIASDLVYPNFELGRAIEWKSSSMRRQTQRLVREARQFAHTGYRSLLRGQMRHLKNQTRASIVDLQVTQNARQLNES